MVKMYLSIATGALSALAGALEIKKPRAARFIRWASLAITAVLNDQPVEALPAEFTQPR